MVRARRSIRRLAELDVDVLVFSHFGTRRGPVQTELAALAGPWADRVSA
jgi:hypothetical protein